MLTQPKTLTYEYRDGETLTVRYYYTPGTPDRMRGHPDTWEPGAPAECEIVWVFDGQGADVKARLESGTLADIEEAIAVTEDEARLDAADEAAERRAEWERGE